MHKKASLEFAPGQAVIDSKEAVGCSEKEIFSRVAERVSCGSQLLLDSFYAMKEIEAI